MTGRRPRNIAATRAAILESALRLFTQHGYGGVGVREIAEGARADKALITRYFGSKEGLFAEAVPPTFDPTELLTGDRAEFGRRMATHIVDHRAGSDIDPMIATIRSRRAALMTAHVMGLSIAVNILALSPLTELGRDELIDLLAPLIQAGIDNTGPSPATPPNS